MRETQNRIVVYLFFFYSSSFGNFIFLMLIFFIEKPLVFARVTRDQKLKNWPFSLGDCAASWWRLLTVLSFSRVEPLSLHLLTDSGDTTHCYVDYCTFYKANPDWSDLWGQRGGREDTLLFAYIFTSALGWRGGVWVPPITSVPSHYSCGYHFSLHAFLTPCNTQKFRITEMTMIAGFCTYYTTNHTF